MYQHLYTYGVCDSKISPVSYLKFGHVFVPILSRRIKREEKNIILSHSHTLKLDEHVNIVCKEMCVLKFVRSIVYHMVVVFCHYHFSGSYPYANMLFVENDKDKSNRDHLTSWPPKSLWRSPCPWSFFIFVFLWFKGKTLRSYSMYVPGDLMYTAEKDIFESSQVNAIVSTPTLLEMG